MHFYQVEIRSACGERGLTFEAGSRTVSETLRKLAARLPVAIPRDAKPG
jgi:hypothetical protein